MDNHAQVKALRTARFASTQEAHAAIPQWLKDGSTHAPGSMDLMMREERHRCKPAILFSAGMIAYEYIIRTRSEEQPNGRWIDYVEVYVSQDYVLSYTFKDGIVDALERGTIALSPDTQQELSKL